MRIVSLSPSVTETLVLLGLEDEIVGITPWCRMYLERPENKKIAGTYLNILYDVLEEISPDIVFLQSRVHDRFFRDLREKGFNTYLIPLPTNVYGIISHIVLDVGAIVGRYYESRELGAKSLERVSDMIRRSNTRKRPRIYVEYLWPDKTYSTAGALTYIDDGVRIAGGENIFRDTPKEFFTPSNKEIIKRDPDIILVNIEPVMRNMTLSRYKEIRGELEETRALRENRVVLVVESRRINLAHFGPSFIETIEWLRNTLNQFHIADS